MYKMALACEEQAKPERAEAVLEWMKRTQGTPASSNPGKQEATTGPQRLGRYVIEKRIGRGAMGAVYLAKDPRINRPVALKVIPIEKEFEDEELREARLRFYREAESAGRLAHPNIITVFDAGEDKGLAYIAMEYVPGIPLKKFTDPQKLLAPKRALELCASTAEADRRRRFSVTPIVSLCAISAGEVGISRARVAAGLSDKPRSIPSRPGSNSELADCEAAVFGFSLLGPIWAGKAVPGGIDCIT